MDLRAKWMERAIRYPASPPTTGSKGD